MAAYKNRDKPCKAATPPHPPLKATRLPDQMRERLRYMHYSLRTEQTYLFWVRWFIRFSGLLHPKEMGQVDFPGHIGGWDAPPCRWGKRFN